MSTLPEDHLNPEVQKAFDDLKAQMEQSCKELNIPMSQFQEAVLKEMEEDNQSKHIYAATKTEKKPAGVIRRWLSTLFGNN